MDIATGVGLIAGTAVVCALILLGGGFRMFYDLHAVMPPIGASLLR
jgi:chemotaxis protein MotA